jgi:hypothetical protein
MTSAVLGYGGISINETVTVNSAGMFVGTGFTANGTLVNANSISVVSDVSTVTHHVSGHINVGTSFSVNTSTLTIAGMQLVANGSTGSAGQVLTSGNSTSNVYWSTVVGGSGGGVGGSGFTDVLFNDSGTVNGASGFTFTKGTNTVYVSNAINAGSVLSTFAVINQVFGTSYTTSQGDSGAIITTLSNNPTTITVGSSMAANSRFLITQLALGQVTVQAAGGVTLVSRTGTNTMKDQYGSISVFMANSTLAVLDGNLTTAAPGSDTDVLFNELGAVTGSSNLTFDYGTSTLSIAGPSSSTQIGPSTFAYNAASPQGHFYLPGNLLVNYGQVVCNSVGQNAVTFDASYSSNAYSITVTGITATGSTVKTAVNFISASGFTLLVANGTATTNTGIPGAYYMAVGV